MGYENAKYSNSGRFFNPVMWQKLYEAGLTNQGPEHVDAGYKEDEIRGALSEFCAGNAVGCRMCRTFFNGIGSYCKGSAGKPRIGALKSSIMEQAIKELEALWYLPLDKRQNHRENEWYLSVILNSRRLGLMKSKVFREAMKRQIEIEIDSSPYEPPEGLG